MNRIATIAAITGFVGLVLFVIGVVLEPRQALTSYVFAYAAMSTVVLGALIQVMMSNVTGARWFTVMRRITLHVTGAMPALVILAIPLFAGAAIIYSWTSPSMLPAATRAIVDRKVAWLNMPFFIVRGVVYLGVWLAVAEILRGRSLRRDETRGLAAASETQRLRRFSAGGLVAVGLTLTFASFDWLMSLEPTWYSTVYGVYVFAGGFVSALGLIAILARISSRAGVALDGVVTPEHFGALGKLLLTFVIFWAYIAFSQFLIIWIGDVPLDASWYLTRTSGSWGTLALIVVIGQFALPFVLLLPRAPKRRPRFLAAIGWLLLATHVLDSYWLVLPALHPLGMAPSWLDVAALLMVGGLTAAAAVWRARGQSLLPLGDPYVARAMQYVEP
ncbi:MAG TPA: hypothetical protein VGH98_22425 [Gemmatimonadaceae bacterium]|jgi:hypothetical protein